MCRGVGGCTRMGTLAWVTSTCTERGYEQKLQIRRGDCDPIPVLDFPGPLPPPPCDLIGEPRFGFVSAPVTGAFHRLGVTPDGRRVVFEVTDDFSLLAPDGLVPPDDEGIFVVRADGRRLRRIGPASRDASFSILQDVTAGGFRAFVHALVVQTERWIVVLTDLGPGPGGEEAIRSSRSTSPPASRTQLTRLRFEPDHPVGRVSLQKGTCCRCS